MKLNNIVAKIYSIIPKNFQNIWKKIEKSDIGSRIANGFFWSLSGSVISQSLVLLASIVVARILGITKYGELGIIRSTVTVFSVFAAFSLGLAATKYISEFVNKDKIKSGKIIFITSFFSFISGALIAIIAMILAPFLAEEMFNAPQLVNEIRISAIILFFSALNGAQTGILAGFEAFKRIAKINLYSGILAFPVQVILTFLYGLSGSIVAFGLSFFILWIFNLRAVKQECNKHNITIQYENSIEELFMIIRFSVPALLSGLVVSPVIWYSKTLLVNLADGYNELAIFDAANQWRSSVLFIPIMLSQVILPIFSATDSKNQFNKILNWNISINFIIALLMAIVLSLFSGYIMGAYGDGFESGSHVIIILALTSVFFSISVIIGQAIVSKEKMWLTFFFNLLWSVVFLTTAFVLFDFGYGAKGLAYSYLTSYAFLAVIQLIYVNYFLKLELKTI